MVSSPDGGARQFIHTILYYATLLRTHQDKKNVCESLKDWPEMLVRVLLDLFTGD